MSKTRWDDFWGYVECNNMSLQMLNCTCGFLVSKYYGEESFSHKTLTFPTGEQKVAEGINFNPFFLSFHL